MLLHSRGFWWFAGGYVHALQCAAPALVGSVGTGAAGGAPSGPSTLSW